VGNIGESAGIYKNMKDSGEYARNIKEQM
jgi:hypothetical protein